MDYTLSKEKIAGHELLDRLLPGNDEPVINWTQLTKLMSNDEDFIKDVVEGWLVDNPAAMDALTKAVKANKFDEMFAFAHKIKGSAETVRGDLLAQAASLFETAVEERKLEDIKITFAVVQKEFEKFKSFLSRSDWMEIAKNKTKELI
ncbi:MAG TPA: hypothetical protein DDX75_16685 [Phycisphaerales bacterium]|nr:hypothetical protein [Phycisphaerales bacterium]